MLQVIFTQLYDKVFGDKFHIAKSHVVDLIGKPYKQEVIKIEDLEVRIYLSELIDNKFYLLVGGRIKDGSFTVDFTFKILKELVEDEQDLNAIILIQKLAWKCGLILKVGNQLSKFINREEIKLLRRPNEGTPIIQVSNIHNHSFINGFYFKVVLKAGNYHTVCALAFCIDTDQYLSWINNDVSGTIVRRVDDYKKRLSECNPGKVNWSKYEDLCIEIVEFLFSDSFKTFNAKAQSLTLDGVERRDFLVANRFKKQPSFWSIIKDEFEANQIIFEFKNLSGEARSEEVGQIYNYMNTAVGHFGIIFSRKGLSQNGDKAVQRKYNQRGNGGKSLILSFDDLEIIKMLDMVAKEKDPEDLLFSKKEEFERNL